MVQKLIDAVDNQITKTRSPLVNTLIALPIFVIVSLPIAMIAAVLVLIAIGTTPSVGQDGTMPGVIAGVVTILLFTIWAAYGTYTSNRDLQENGTTY